MLAQVLKRCAAAPLVLLVLSLLTFLLMRLAPEGPFDADRKAPPEVEAALKAQYHLDESMPRQYLRFLGDVVTGDLGPSFRYPGRRVSDIIRDRLPPSLALGGLALALAVGGGLLLGVGAALFRRGLLDRLAVAVSALGLCLPAFVVGPLVLLVFQTRLAWISPPVHAAPSFAYLLLAAAVLSLPYLARIARLSRAGVLEVIESDAVRAATARGLSPLRVVVRHVLPPACVPVVAFLGPATAAVLTGSVVVEMVFQLKGLGFEFVHAASNRDYNLVMGTVLVYGALLIACNVVMDLLLMVLDPRVRRG